MLEILPQCWGLCPKTPVGLQRLGAPPPDSQVATLTQLTCFSWPLLTLLGIVEITTFYLILETMVGPP